MDYLHYRLLFIDVETTGLSVPTPLETQTMAAYPRHLASHPYIVAVHLIATDVLGNCPVRHSFVVRPRGFTIPLATSLLHGVTDERAYSEGMPLDEVLSKVMAETERADLIVGHNIAFDLGALAAELCDMCRDVEAHRLCRKACLCTMTASVNYCALPRPDAAPIDRSSYKYPRLFELYESLFHSLPPDLFVPENHVVALARACFALTRLGVLAPLTGYGFASPLRRSLLRCCNRATVRLPFESMKLWGYSLLVSPDDYSLVSVEQFSALPRKADEVIAVAQRREEMEGDRLLIHRTLLPHLFPF